MSSKSRYNKQLDKQKRKRPYLLPKDQYANDIDGRPIRTGDLVYIVEWKPIHVSYAELGSAGEFYEVEKGVAVHEFTGRQAIFVKSKTHASSLGVWVQVGLYSEFVRRV